MSNNKQFFPSTELRAYSEEGKMRVSGYAIVFNSESRDLGGFTEFISQEAVSEDLINNNDVLALYNHDYANVLGRQSANTLRLYKDERGVKYDLDLPDTTLGRDIYELVKRGDLKGNSFGFTVRKDSWKKVKDKVVRTIEEIKNLFEISIVSLPAYDATELALRSFNEFVQDEDPIIEEPQEETPTVDQEVNEEVEMPDENLVYPQSILKHI